MTAATLREGWLAAAAGARQSERIAMAEASRYEARGDVATGERLRREAAASGVRSFVLSMAAELVLGGDRGGELLRVVARGVQLVCTHAPVEAPTKDLGRCRCALARELAEACIAESSVAEVCHAE